MTSGPASTVDLEYFRPEQRARPTPGLVVVFQGSAPRFEIHPLADGELEIGRSAPAGATLSDPTMSRRHARVRFAGGLFEVEDLGSRNGLVVDGRQVAPGQSQSSARILRAGETVMVLEADIRPLQGKVDVEDGMVVGPRLRSAWNAIDSIATSSDIIHIRGESGAGKELAAQRFHDSGRTGKRPFIAVNCATIPQGVAERLLFGARKGAFSGAHADAEGLIQAAHGGTLFLDEVGELDLEVQAKLLRVIETRTVLPVGEVKAQQVEIRLVSATHRDLRKQVADRTFREDLYFRIGRPEIELPALRERPVELPWLVDLAIRDVHPGASATPALIEACLLRTWPGNVRELALEAREAARRAQTDGSSDVLAEHLDASAGRAHESSAESTTPAPRRIDKSMLPDRETIESALRETGGRVATAARKLGIHRNQLRRWLTDNGVDPQSFGES